MTGPAWQTWNLGRTAEEEEPLNLAHLILDIVPNHVSVAKLTNVFRLLCRASRKMYDMKVEGISSTDVWVVGKEDLEGSCMHRCDITHCVKVNRRYWLTASLEGMSARMPNVKTIYLGTQDFGTRDYSLKAFFAKLSTINVRSADHDLAALRAANPGVTVQSEYVPRSDSPFIDLTGKKYKLLSDLIMANGLRCTCPLCVRDQYCTHAKTEWCTSCYISIDYLTQTRRFDCVKKDTNGPKAAKKERKHREKEWNEHVINHMLPGETPDGKFYEWRQQ